SDVSQRMTQVILYWRALAQMNTSYTVFVHLLDAQGKVIAAGDAVPGNGDFPTTGWIEDEYITDAHTLSLENVPPGTYQIEIGVYDPVTGARLKTTDSADRLLFPPLQIP
ncbi:MAG: Gmad2 immunoglobulin-like domain-containing protein, partial [Anaerolineales bacterium]|nr:Gmad2 immunoglobulin-like domain-containing protein [Anaerolineales bacterium]